MLRWFLVLLGVSGLIMVRVLERHLFYDPFLQYFETADHSAEFPSFVWGKLIFGYIFRFVLNTVFSLWIVYFLFRSKVLVKQSLVLMILIFLLVFPIYLYCIYDRFQFGYLFSFYIRRFVIQPMAIILIIPVYYYLLKSKN